MRLSFPTPTSDMKWACAITENSRLVDVEENSKRESNAMSSAEMRSYPSFQQMKADEPGCVDDAGDRTERNETCPAKPNSQERMGTGEKHIFSLFSLPRLSRGFYFYTVCYILYRSLHQHTSINISKKKKCLPKTPHSSHGDPCDRIKLVSTSWVVTSVRSRSLFESAYIYMNTAILSTGGVLLYLPHHLDLASEDSVGHSTSTSVLARRRAIMGSIVQPKRSCLGAATCWSQYMQARRRAMCWGFRCTPPAVEAPRQGRLG